MHRHHAAVAALLRDVAAAVVVPRFRNLAAHEVVEKAPGELVTIADREAEARLSGGLAAIDSDAAILGEEACAADPSRIEAARAARAWIIDPIDGTANFASGQSPFGMMIALVEQSVTQAGWLYDPVTTRLCHAVLGGGAFVNDRPVKARPSEGAPIAALSKLDQSEAAHAAHVARLSAAFALVPLPRCAAENYPRLVLGQHDVAVFRRTLVWDHAPGALFLTEAGGYVARWDGSPYRIGDGGVGIVAASSRELGERATALLFG